MVLRKFGLMCISFYWPANVECLAEGEGVRVTPLRLSGCAAVGETLPDALDKARVCVQEDIREKYPDGGFMFLPNDFIREDDLAAGHMTRIRIELPQD